MQQNATKRPRAPNDGQVVRTYVRCQAFRGKFSQREKRYKSLQSFSTRNRPNFVIKSCQNLTKDKKYKKTPKHATKRNKAPKSAQRWPSGTYVRTYAVRLFMVNFHIEKKGTNRCKVVFDQKSTTNPNKSYKIAKKRKKAPKGTQERHKARATHSCSDLGAVLGRSWGALGTPRAAPNAAKSTKIGARSEFFTFF